MREAGQNIFPEPDSSKYVTIQNKVSQRSSMGSFKCYVTLEGVGGYMPKRYEALRGGGGLRQRYVTSFFL